MNTLIEKKETDINEIRLIYIIAFGISAIGLIALDSYMRDAIFTMTAMIILGIGFYQSLRYRLNSGYDYTDALRYVFAIFFTGYLMIHVMRYEMLRMDSFQSTSSVMSVAISFLILLISFFIVSDQMLLFSCISPLSLIGLTGTMGQDETILGFFGLYIIFAGLLIIRQSAVASKKFRIKKYMPLEIHTGFILIVTIIALVIGVLMGKFVFEPIDNQILAKIIGPIRMQPYAIQDIDDSVPVGPPPNSSSDELMTLKSNEPLLLRGQTFNTYNGYRWRDNRPMNGDMLRGNNVTHYTDFDFDQPVQSKFDIVYNRNESMRKSVRPIEQVITITKGYNRLLFGAAEIDTIVFDAFHTLFKTDKLIATSRFRGKNEKYKVISLVSNASPDELRKAPAVYSNHILKNYMETPPLEYDIKELSDKICAGIKNPYDKAIAIQRYLEENYTYDTNTSMNRDETDMASNFLFRTKRGHCTLFATAMAMLSRHANIPARLATGFTSGSYDESRGLYSISAANKHAWAELYFPNYGWISFDPTAISSEMDMKDKIAKTIKNSIGFLVANRITLIISAIILLLLVYIVKTELLDRFSGKSKSAEKAIVSKASQTYKKMCLTLSKYGYKKDPSDTPLEFALRVRNDSLGDMSWLHSIVDSATADIISVRYAADNVPESRLKQTADEVKKLEKELKSAKRKGIISKKADKQ